MKPMIEGPLCQLAFRSISFQLVGARRLDAETWWVIGSTVGTARERSSATSAHTHHTHSQTQSQSNSDDTHESVVAPLRHGVGTGVLHYNLTQPQRQSTCRPLSQSCDTALDLASPLALSAGGASVQRPTHATRRSAPCEFLLDAAACHHKPGVEGAPQDEADSMVPTSIWWACASAKAG